MQADNTSPITINVRQNTGTYIAKAPGLKPTASCSTGPRQAAESLAQKLGLAPGLIQEQPSDGLGYGCSRFVHPGELATKTSDNCDGCGRFLSDRQRFEDCPNCSARNAP